MIQPDDRVRSESNSLDEPPDYHDDAWTGDLEDGPRFSLCYTVCVERYLGRADHGTNKVPIHFLAELQRDGTRQLHIPAGRYAC